MNDQRTQQRLTGRGIWMVILVIVGVGVSAAVWTIPNRSAVPSNTVAVTEGEFAVRSVYNGKLESRHVVTIMSRFDGTATIVELAGEGDIVAEGDTLVKFDDARLTRDIVKLEKDYHLAQSELESLTNAKLPLELRELEMALLEIETELAAENKYLQDSRTLYNEDLVSIQEVQQQERKVQRLESKLETIRFERDLTREHLHPSLIDSARANLKSAEQALALAQRQLEATRVTAPEEGVVVYKPLHIGGEFRTVRVGDSLYPNQPFMVIPDMKDLVVHIDVPESELSNVLKGRQAYITPLAYPDLTLPGTVETVGSVAQTQPGQPAWQKFFHVKIGVDRFEPAIRPGMSVTAYILSHYRANTVMIPRRAVTWNENKALAQVAEGDSYVTRELALGPANDTFYEVLAGVEPGDEVALR